MLGGEIDGCDALQCVCRWLLFCLVYGVLTSIWCPTFHAYSGEAKSATACITSTCFLQMKTILLDFNLAVSTLTTKPIFLVKFSGLMVGC